LDATLQVHYLLCYVVNHETTINVAWMPLLQVHYLLCYDVNRD